VPAQQIADSEFGAGIRVQIRNKVGRSDGRAQS
jgi:hypothetical protein